MTVEYETALLKVDHDQASVSNWLELRSWLNSWGAHGWKLCQLLPDRPGEYCAIFMRGDVVEIAQGTPIVWQVRQEQLDDAMTKVDLTEPGETD